MKKIFHIFLFILVWISIFFQVWYADYDNNNWILNLSSGNIRNGDVSFNDIPNIIVGATSFILWFSATISMLMIIVWALKMQIWRAVSNEHAKGKEAIKYWILWFILSITAYLIMNIVVNNI
jgi:hypothetical protein